MELISATPATISFHPRRNFGEDFIKIGSSLADMNRNTAYHAVALIGCRGASISNLGLTTTDFTGSLWTFAQRMGGLIREVQLGLLRNGISVWSESSRPYQCRSLRTDLYWDGNLRHEERATRSKVSLHDDFIRQRERSAEYSWNELSRQARRQLRSGSAVTVCVRWAWLMCALLLDNLQSDIARAPFLRLLNFAACFIYSNLLRLWRCCNIRECAFCSEARS